MKKGMERRTRIALSRCEWMLTGVANRSKVSKQGDKDGRKTNAPVSLCKRRSEPRRFGQSCIGMNLEIDEGKGH